MIQINGLHWFIAALILCTVHTLHLRACRRERRKDLAWWQKYEADAKQRHASFMERTDHISRMVGVFGAACAWRRACRIPGAAVKTFETRLIAEVDAAHSARKRDPQ